MIWPKIIEELKNFQFSDFLINFSKSKAKPYRSHRQCHVAFFFNSNSRLELTSLRKMSFRGRGTAQSQPFRPAWVTPRYPLSASQGRDQHLPSTNYHDAVLRNDNRKPTNTNVVHETNTKTLDKMKDVPRSAPDPDEEEEEEDDWQYCKPCQTKFTNRSVSRFVVGVLRHLGLEKLH